MQEGCSCYSTSVSPGPIWSNKKSSHWHAPTAVFVPLPHHGLSNPPFAPNKRCPIRANAENVSRRPNCEEYQSTPGLFCIKSVHMALEASVCIERGCWLHKDRFLYVSCIAVLVSMVYKGILNWIWTSGLMLNRLLLLLNFWVVLIQSLNQVSQGKDQTYSEVISPNRHHKKKRHESWHNLRSVVSETKEPESIDCAQTSRQHRQINQSLDLHKYEADIAGTLYRFDIPRQALRTAERSRGMSSEEVSSLVSQSMQRTWSIGNPIWF